MNLLILLSAFTAASLLVVAAYYLFSSQPRQLAERLEEVSRQAGGTMTAPAVAVPFTEVLQRIIRPFGRVIAPGPKATVMLKRRLQQAGIYGEHATVNYSAGRFILAVGMPFVALTGLQFAGANALRFFFFFPVLALLGFGFPGMWLSSKINRRKLLIRNGLADACDLMVSCVEAGLSLNAALIRVSNELNFAHPDIAKEFSVTSLEIRAGNSREDGLRHLGERTGVKDLKSFAAMLIQTDKFGTSIARALRVFSDTLRTKRRQRAEEAAAKTTIKLVFPLVFFIFPAILLLILGPGVIRLMESFANVNH